MSVRERGLVIKRDDTLLDNVLKDFIGFLVRYEKCIVYGGTQMNEINTNMIALI
jgi:hypothetical protein